MIPASPILKVYGEHLGFGERLLYMGRMITFQYPPNGRCIPSALKMTQLGPNGMVDSEEERIATKITRRDRARKPDKAVTHK